MAITTKEDRRQRRRWRIRKRVTGTSERPRMVVVKSSRHLYVQVIDDAAGHTVAAATTNTKANRTSGKKSFSNLAGGQLLGKEIAEKAKSAGVDAVVFDRAGYPYHGVIKAVAEAAREAGLKF